MKKSFVPKQPKNILPACVVACLGLGVLNLFVNLVVIGTVSSVSNKPPPRLVESADGVAKSVVALSHSEPTPESIRQFVASTLYGLYDWRGILPPETAEDIGSPKPDPGVGVSSGKGGKGSRKITTSSWRHGFRLSDPIRKDVLTQISLITPQDIFTDNPSSQTAMTTPTIGIPQKVEEGLWKVDFSGMLVVFASGNNLGDQIIREHEVFVRVIDPLVPVSTGPNVTHVSDIQKVVMEERSYGLVIESMPERVRS